jgi:hypothetical protein
MSRIGLVLRYHLTVDSELPTDTSSAPTMHCICVLPAGSNDSGLLGRRPKPADDSSSNSAGDAAAADFSWTAVRVEALEPYPLADVAVGQEHALAVTQQVGRF